VRRRDGTVVLKSSPERTKSVERLTRFGFTRRR
jgi:hypothetical protein